MFFFCFCLIVYIFYRYCESVGIHVKMRFRCRLKFLFFKIVIDMPEHKGDEKGMGGTMRLGLRDTLFLTENCKLRKSYYSYVPYAVMIVLTNCFGLSFQESYMMQKKSANVIGIVMKLILELFLNLVELVCSLSVIFDQF